MAGNVILILGGTREAIKLASAISASFPDIEIIYSLGHLQRVKMDERRMNILLHVFPHI